MRKVHYNLIFSVFLFLLFVWAAWLAFSFSELAKFFPYYIAIGGVVLTLAQVIINIVAVFKEKKIGHTEQELAVAAEATDKEEETGSVLRYMAWIIGYIAFIYIIGFLTATTLFLIFFLYFESKFSILKTALSLIITMAVIHIFANSINLYWPEGIFPLWPF